jgi:hypothetical protein
LRVYGLIPGRCESFLLSKNAQTSSGLHSAIHGMGTMGSSIGGKVARAWGWPLTYSPKIEWSCVSAPPCVFMTCREQHYLYLIPHHHFVLSVTYLRSTLYDTCQ